jgi:hypothetical protein
MSDGVSMLRVSRPRVLRVERADPFRISCGDRATVEVGRGLLQLLTLSAPGGIPLGDGYAAEWTIPVGAGATAAYSVLERTGVGTINPVTGVHLSAEWRRPATVADTLEASAVLESTGQSSLRFGYRVTSKELGDELVCGTVVLVVMAGGVKAPFLPEFYAPPRPPLPLPPAAGAPSPTVAEPAALALPAHAVLGPVTARTEDGSATLHRVAVLGGDTEPSTEAPVRLAMTVPESGDEVAALALYYRGQRLLTLGPGYPSWPTIYFVAQSRSGYEVEIRIKETPGSAPRRWVEEGEEPQPDLLRIAGPSLVAGKPAGAALPALGASWEWRYPADLLRFLVSPVGGGAEPLGRRVHPYGLISMAATLDAARRVLPVRLEPESFTMEWTKAVNARDDMAVRLSVAAAAADRVELECSVSQCGEVVSPTRATFAAVRS